MLTQQHAKLSLSLLREAAFTGYTGTMFLQHCNLSLTRRCCTQSVLKELFEPNMSEAPSATSNGPESGMMPELHDLANPYPSHYAVNTECTQF